MQITEEKLIELMEMAYFEGFYNSGEGYNGEYGADPKDVEQEATQFVDTCIIEFKLNNTQLEY